MMSKKVYVKPYPKEFREQVVKLVQLGQLLGDEHEVWQVTKPTPEASKRLKLMGIRAPEPILKLV